MGKTFDVNLTAVMLDGVMKDPETKMLTDHIRNTKIHVNANEKESITLSSKNIDVLVGYINQLQKQITELKQTNPTDYTSIDAITDETADAIISVSTPVEASSFTNSTANITAKSVQVKKLEVNSVRLNVTASEDVIISGFTSEGELAKSISNASTSINTDGYVTIKDSTVAQSGYNAVEIGASATLKPAGVTIDNVRFSGVFKNNVISVFGTEDEAIINISNCAFDDCSNPVRISNKSNGKVTINFVNCEFTQWEGDHATGSMDYNGAVICQDYTSATASAAEENNLFAPEKVKINFINCTHNGQKIVAPASISEVCGSGDEKQLIYVYRDKGGLVVYDPAKYPQVTIS